MPKTQIDLPYRVEYLSILDEDGHLDPELDPNLSTELLLRLYRAMVLARRFDERMLSLQRQGRIGTFGPIKGQEASQLGAVAALQAEDWMVPSFREAAAELWRGKSLESFLLYFGGYDEGGAVEAGRNDLPIAIPVGSQTLHAVGLGYGIQYRKRPQVVMTFFGDGATSEGDFHEAMNFAGVFQLPVIFVCQNNHWAISIPRSRQTRSQTLAQKALAYGMPGIQVDGNDILAVYAAAREAVDRARTGGGPTMIECVTYRVAMHTTADDPNRYRTEQEVEPWLKRDPILRFQKYLKDRGLLDDAAIAGIEQDIQVEIQAAVDRAEAVMRQPVDPLDMFDHHFADLPDHLREQRQQLQRELTANPGEVDHG
ncbi:MAG TPA: pyruvate dehydrogenase (acetyl-transferring) E1 component subunit alpha [Syntrophobacteraceae bacterium]|nr:pyruvate dehydrogenase (acetyl-transferring) E1 component subunit alpha [Syntrophobacteraceae bacterium]